MSRKDCSICGQTKPLEDFRIRADTGKPFAPCSSCLTDRNSASCKTEKSKKRNNEAYLRYVGTPEKAAHRALLARTAYLKRKYDISLKDYESLVESCLGGCCICGLTPEGGQLYVDHDHQTGEVRGGPMSHMQLGIGPLPRLGGASGQGYWLPREECPRWRVGS